ncbi:cytochrome P450 family protein [Streptomonospora litoralis]|uniref:Cytochrome P450-SU1 n=1 Tax=Streptomonospora litoralis TaxID=2498135 RepID=A0A4P6Q7P3_9ACTN|nr:cytochrome P450 [Streptomonospora litoralis]QBI54994.1 Cytochrome P450-SU1 [Streptomonospora litoralis]
MTQPRQFPAAPLRLDDPHAFSDPASLWDRLLAEYPRGLAPVYLEEGVSGWLMLTPEVHRTVLNTPDVFAGEVRHWRDFNNGRIPATSPLRAIYTPRRNIWSVDGPEHERYRRALVASLTTMSERYVVGEIGAVADRIVDSFCADGAVDLVARYSGILPLLVLCRLFGMEEDEGLAVCTAMQRVWNYDEDAAHAHAQVQRYMDDLIARRRERAGQDLVSALIGHGLDDEEVRDNLTFLIAAAHEPVAQAIAQTIRLLLVRRNRYLQINSVRTIRETINASLWEAPPLHTLIGRFTTREVELGGFRLAAGDCLVLGFGPAQHAMRRDPRLDLETNRSYLIFGLGEHGCPERGRDLALTMAEKAVQRLDQRLPDMALADDTADDAPAAVIAGVHSLRVRYTPADPLQQGALWKPQSASTPTTSTATPPHGRSTLLGRLFGWIWRD